MKGVSKRVCSRIAGCTAYSCDDEGCLGKKIATHTAPVSASATSVLHNHKWYYQKRWRTIRLGQLSRQPLCERCKTFDIVTAAKHVDHVTPHKGSAKLFFDAGNLQSLCHNCHSFKTREEEKGNYQDFRNHK